LALSTVIDSTGFTVSVELDEPDDPGEPGASPQESLASLFKSSKLGELNILDLPLSLN
jgi:hypothetical protein